MTHHLNTKIIITEDKQGMYIFDLKYRDEEGGE